MSLTISKDKLKISPDNLTYSAELSGKGIPKVLKKVFINIELKAEEDSTTVLDTLITKTNDILQNLDGFATKATEELYELFTEEWNEEEEEVSKEEFASRLKLESIAARSSDCEIFFDDGELFAGHVIVVNLDAEGNVVSADIAG